MPRLLLVFLLASIPMWCQVDRATLTGTLRDPSGAAVADAKVTARFQATGLTRSVNSTAAGVYLIGGLPIGSASIEIEKDGFRAIHSEVDLNVGQTRTLDFTFEVASLSSSVDVVAEADLVRNSAEYGAT